jgi:hypothetical protein
VRNRCDPDGLRLSQESVRYAAPLLCLVFLGCGTRPGPSSPPKPLSTPKPAPSPLSVAGELTQNRTVLSNGKGKRVLELTGGRLELAPGASQATLRGTQAILYRDGRPSLTILAKEILVEKASRKLTAQGSVSAEAADGRKVRCDTLTWITGANLAASLKDKASSWRDELGVVTGSGNVAFTSGAGMALYGSRLTTDTLLGTFQLEP